MPLRPRLSIALWSPLVLALGCAFDLSLSQLRNPWASGSLAALCAATGLLSGLLWELAFALLTRARRAVAILVWLLFACGLGAWMSVALGTFERLGTRYHDLALITLVAAACGVPLLCVALLALQPSARRPLGRLAEAGTRVLVVRGLALAAAAAWCFLADRPLLRLHVPRLAPRVAVGLPAGRYLLAHPDSRTSTRARLA